MRSAETVALETAFNIQLGYRLLVGFLRVNRSSNTLRQATTQRARLFVPVIKVVTILKQYCTEEAMFQGLRNARLKDCALFKSQHVAHAGVPPRCKAPALGRAPDAGIKRDDFGTKRVLLTVHRILFIQKNWSVALRRLALTCSRYGTRETSCSKQKGANTSSEEEGTA